jgi:Tfp pilus assembly protein FimT
VLALITVVAAIAIPLFYSRPAVTLDNAAILLARDLRAAQNEAVHRRKDVYAHFFGDGSGYRVFDESGEALKNPTGSGELVRRYTADAVFEGVRVASVEFGPRHMARFTPDGLAVRGGVVVLEFRGDQRILTLAEGSGLVEITGLERPWVDDGL